MSFSQDALMAFVAAVDHGSISAGARQLGKRQSTLSESLANLEIDLGLTLFQQLAGEDHGRRISFPRKACQCVPAPNRCCRTCQAWA